MPSVVHRRRPVDRSRCETTGHSALDGWQGRTTGHPVDGRNPANQLRLVVSGDRLPRRLGKYHAFVWGGWGGVGVMITFLFFAHMVDATRLAVFLLVLICLVLRWSCFRVGGLGWGGGDDHVPVLCTYGGCYATCSPLSVLDSPHSKRYKSWCVAEGFDLKPRSLSDDDVAESSTPFPENTSGIAFPEALRSRAPDVPETVWPTRAGPILHYLNVVRNVDGWNLRLSPGRRPAGILVLPAGMSRMQLLLAVRRTPIVHSQVDPISGWILTRSRNGGAAPPVSIASDRTCYDPVAAKDSRPFDLSRLQELDLRLRQEYNSVENGLCRNAR